MASSSDARLDRPPRFLADPPRGRRSRRRGCPILRARAARAAQIEKRREGWVAPWHRDLILRRCTLLVILSAALFAESKDLASWHDTARYALVIMFLFTASAHFNKNAARPCPYDSFVLSQALAPRLRHWHSRTPRRRRPSAPTISRTCRPAFA